MVDLSLKIIRPAGSMDSHFMIDDTVIPHSEMIRKYVKYQEDKARKCTRGEINPSK